VIALFAELTGIQSPSYGTIRQWVYRLGYYCLSNTPLLGKDWVMILDHTVELGKEKCLVILGVPQETFQSGHYALNHQDVYLIGLDVVTSSTGERVHAKMEEVSQRYGAPVQVVSDYGPDVKKGVELFCRQHQGTIHTYDISHLVASLFKKEFKDDERFESLGKAITHTAKKINQTDLLFLAPPNQRTKARFMNVEHRIEWEQRIFDYLERGDFSEVEAGFFLSESQAIRLKIFNSTRDLAKLTDIAEKFFHTREEFEQALQACIGATAFTKYKCLIRAEADIGKRKVEEAFSWILEYREDIETYAQMCRVAKSVLTFIKCKGLGMKTYKELCETLASLSLQNPRALAFKKKILSQIYEQASKIPLGETWLGCSDVVESLFGKYKQILIKSTFKTIGRLVLTLPLMTTLLTNDLVMQAMETTKNRDLEQWADNTFGMSALTKRKRAFSGYQKQDELILS